MNLKWRGMYWRLLGPHQEFSDYMGIRNESDSLSLRIIL